MSDIEIATDRLRLRQWRLDDFEPFAAFYADPCLARYVGGPLSRHDAWRKLAGLIGHWRLRGYGYWAAEETATGTLVGCVGLGFPEGWPELELGYWLVGTAHGKGLATEAGRRVRRYAFETVGTDELVSYIHPDNEPSKRVAERLGARLDGMVELLDHGPHCVYRHTRP